IPALNDYLYGKEPKLRSVAATVLGKIGEPAGPTLVAALKDSDPEVRRLAVHGLSVMEKGPKDAVEPLVDALKDKEKETRIYAATALKAIGKDANSATAPLRVLLKDEEDQVRLAAANALVEINSDLRPLIELLKDPELGSEAAFELGHREAKEA